MRSRRQARDKQIKVRRPAGHENHEADFASVAATTGNFIGNNGKALEINGLLYVCHGLPARDFCVAGKNGSLALI